MIPKIRTKLLLSLLLPALSACSGKPTADDTSRTDTDSDTAPDTENTPDVETGKETGTETGETGLAPAPDIRVDPTSLTFSGTDPTVALTATFSIRNEGPAPLEGTIALRDGTVFSVDLPSFSLNPGTFAWVTVRFESGAEGTYTDEVQLASNDPDQPFIGVSLQGGIGTDADGDGWVVELDCDDADPAVNPGAREIWYDGHDSNCDGADDFDPDGDGYGSDDFGGLDCDDADDTVYPGALEAWYDGVDNDCDGGSDYDQDGDGAETSLGIAGSDADCDDIDPAVYPGATETWYDGVDQDCDGNDDDQDGDGVGLAADCDDTDPTIDEVLWWPDVDADGYGDAASTALTDCATLPGYAQNAADCDDTDPARSPAATEQYGDGVDEDCDGRIDDVSVSDVRTGSILGDAGNASGDGLWALDDRDGDGRADLAIAATGDDTAGANAGALALHDADGIGVGAAFTDGWLVVTGVAAGDAFGSAGADLVDRDSDGYASSAVGAWLDDTGATDAGAVYVFDAQDASAGAGTMWAGAASIADARDARIGSAEAAAGFGRALASGDLDADGDPDLLVGATGATGASGGAGGAGGAGAVYVFGAGAVYVFGAGSAWDTGDRTTADAVATLVGDGGDDHLGAALATADLDGDGVDDVVACAPDWDQGANANVGACYVVTGEDAVAAAGTAITGYDTANIVGTSAEDRLGDNANALALGDLDGDGIADIVVGMPGYDAYVTDGGGVVVVVGGGLSGRVAPGGADMLLRGDGALGTAVSLPGDVDGDGLTDLLLGAPTADVLYRVSGFSAGAIQTLPGDEAGSWNAPESDAGALGTAVCGRLEAGEVLELLVSAPGQDDGGTDGGAVYRVPIR